MAVSEHAMLSCEQNSFTGHAEGLVSRIFVVNPPHKELINSKCLHAIFVQVELSCCNTGMGKSFSSPATYLILRIREHQCYRRRDMRCLFAYKQFCQIEVAHVQLYTFVDLELGIVKSCCCIYDLIIILSLALKLNKNNIRIKYFLS